MKSRVMLVVCFIVLSLAVGTVSAQDTCQDAAGGPIPCTPTAVPTLEPTPIPPDSDGDGWPDADDRCPTQSGVGAPGRADCPDPDGDFITNDGDLCPNDPGPAETGGCPPATATPAADAPQPTALPTSAPSTLNPLRPPADGECAMTTRGLEPVNVRSAPEVDAPVVGTLDPTIVYPADAVVFRRALLFVRKQGAEHPEYVRFDTVFLGGNCAFGQIGVAENAGYVDVSLIGDLAAGTIPGDQCVGLINGEELCDLALPEVNPDGPDAGKSKFCKGLKGWLICTAIEIVAENLCQFIDCPGPNQGGYDDPGDGAEPGDGDAGTGDAGQDGIGDGQVYCEDVIGELLAAAAESEAEGIPAVVNVFGLGPEVEALLLPAVQKVREAAARMNVASCLLEVDAIQPGEAVGSVAPYDRITIEVRNWPMLGEDPLSLFALRGEQATFMGRVLLDVSGDVCIPATHGNFAACPTPPEPGPVAELPLFSPIPEDSTDRLVCDYSDPDDSYCLCDTPSDCVRMVQNFCAGPATCQNWLGTEVCSCDA